MSPRQLTLEAVELGKKRGIKLEEAEMAEAAQAASGYPGSQKMRLLACWCQCRGLPYFVPGPALRY